MELLSRRSLSFLVDGLAADEPIRYRANGNRTVNAEEMLRRIRPVLSAVGIARVAEISQLIPYGFPVFQALRPNVFFHRSIGQNTGSQGKGATEEQAKLSAMMESIESFCAEPRNPNPLIRGSFDFLRSHHVVVDPQCLLHADAVTPPSPTEPLVWTEAWELSTNHKVLVPAEAIFCPFLPEDYGTRSCFPCSSNGLASGATYLEAVLHAIYEVIERHYIAEYEDGHLNIQRFHLTGIVDLHDLVTRGSGFGMSLYSMEMTGIRNLAMIVCFIEDQDTRRTYGGFGCCANVDIALGRAISEAWQSVASRSSGAREDIVRPLPTGAMPLSRLPAERTLRLQDYRQAVVDHEFHSLCDELRFMMNWLKQAGWGSVIVSDLTRHGIDLPVVKAVIPGVTAMRMSRASPGTVTTSQLTRRRHGLPE